MQDRLLPAYTLHFDTNEIMIPWHSGLSDAGPAPARRPSSTLWGVELRISDEQSWRASEQKGDSHHDAYKFRQLIPVMNRVFSNRFHMSKKNLAQLKIDQGDLFP